MQSPATAPSPAWTRHSQVVHSVGPRKLWGRVDDDGRWQVYWSDRYTHVAEGREGSELDALIAAELCIRELLAGVRP